MFFDFWEKNEVRGIVIFFFFAAGCGSWDRLLKYRASAGTHSTPSYDCDTPSDALENQIGAFVCPLCIEVIKPKLPNLEIWGIGKISQMVENG